jgi:hypothetical protein
VKERLCVFHCFLSHFSSLLLPLFPSSLSLLKFGFGVLTHRNPTCSTQLADWLSYEDETGMTVLHMAAGTGSGDGVKWLLEHGADINQVSSQTGMTAMDYARTQNEQATVKLLEEWEGAAGTEVLNSTSGRSGCTLQ